MNPRVQPWLPSRQPVDNVSCLQQIAIQGQQQQRHLLDAIQLPSVQIPQFDGNPLQYYSFVRLFESTVERDTVNSSSRLARLMQYCTGKAKHVISGCTTTDPGVDYLRAKTLLKQRFGDEYTIYEAWINKVTGGPRPATGCLNEANNQKTLVKIIANLPPYLQHSWQWEAGVIEMHKNTTTACSINQSINLLKYTHQTCMHQYR